jgi:hypothetical protein
MNKALRALASGVLLLGLGDGRARLGAALAFLVSPPASADCISDCQAEVYCDSQKQWECSRALGECYQRLCPGSGRAPERKPVTGAYGAIAYDAESGAYGMADASKDAAAARQSALGYCGRYGPKCKIVESFSNTCAAVAQDTGGGVDWAVAADRRTAATKAVEKCTAKSKTGPRCFVRVLHCYSE